MTALSVQLYSVRDDLGERMPDTFARLRALGIDRVEPHDILSAPEELADALAEAGLTAPTAHSSFLRFGTDAVFGAAERVGVRTVILPSAPRDQFATRDGIAGLAAMVNSAAAAASDRGLSVGYHNHEFEFATVVDGRPAWEILAEALDERVVLQLDLHWASVGGADVFDLTQRFGDRIRLLHVNDEELGIEDGFAPNPHDGDSTDVVRAMGDAVDLVVLEVVEDGDVFPALERNAGLFQAVLG